MCGHAQSGTVAFGDQNGFIHVFDRDLKALVKQQYKLFKGSMFGLKYVQDPQNYSKQYIFAIGDDLIPRNSPEEGPMFVIKVFSSTDFGRLLQSFYAAPSLPAGSSPTTFSVHLDGSQIAVGFSSGVVAVFVGNFMKDISNRGLLPLLPQISLPAGPQSISGLHFCELPSTASKPNDRRINLFVVFAPSLLQIPSNESVGVAVIDTSVTVTLAGPVLSVNRKRIQILDTVGSSPMCSSVMKTTRELILCRQDGIYSFSADDRGGATSLDGTKNCLHTLGRYVLVGLADEKSGRLSMIMYDLRNKFVAGSAQLGQGETVQLLFCDEDSAYIVTSARNIVRLREKDTSSKLQVLVNKSLFPLAISIAAEEQCEVTALIGLYESYADYLYQKGDFDGAMVQYCHTIGYIQPSTVIRQFLDSERLPNLVMYLEKLHEKGIASRAHTTLMLTCYAKSKDDVKIDKFVDTFHKAVSLQSDDRSSNSVNAQDDNSFDAVTAVSILMNAGYSDAAYRLGLRHRCHLQCVQVQMSKAPPDVISALSLLSALKFESEGSAGIEIPKAARQRDVASIISTFGKQILSIQPDLFVAFLTRVCIDDYPKIVSERESVSALISVESVTPLFHNSRSLLRRFIEGVFDGLKKQGQYISNKVCCTLLELQLAEYAEIAVSTDNSIVDKSVRMARLSEQVLLILDCEVARYEHSQALLICSIHGFLAGTSYLLEQAQYSGALLLQLRMEAGDEKGLLRVLRREGRKDPDLYMQVLQFFLDKASQSKPLPDDDDEDEDK